MKKKYTSWKKVDFDEVVKYYESHSREETLLHFNLSHQGFYSLLRSHNYKKPRDLVVNEYIKTCQEKYGVDNFFQTSEGIRCSHTSEANKKRKDSSIITMNERYGVDWYTSTDDLQSKAHSDDAINKSKQTMLERYGYECVLSCDWVRDKAKQNNLEKYGTENVLTLEWVRDKAKQTNLEKYGVENPFSSDEIKLKIKQTNLEKYGEDNYVKTLEYHKKARKRYKYDNEFFDSSYELALWIYAKDHNENIERASIKFEYVYDDKVHYYFPDFIYCNNIVEVKGPHFFTEDGLMCNPFDHSQDGLYEAKHQCGIKNGVLFISDNTYVNYCIATYGNNWIDKFTNN